MTEATPTLYPWGSSEDVRKLVARGKSRGLVTMDEVVLALRHEELTTEVIEGVRALLAAEGIELDESVPPVDDLEHIDPGGAPLPSVEAELHEARDAAYAAGDFEEDGPELGGVRPARSAAARRRVLRVASSPDRSSGRHRRTRCGCTSRRSVGSRCSPVPRRSSTPGAWSRAGFAATRLADLAASGQLAHLEFEERRALQRARPSRRGRPRGAHRGQPAARRVDRQALRRARHALPRPDPGGEPRPDAGRREVRLHEGLQVLHLRHLVDPAGHHAGHRRPGPHDPHPRAHGRVDQQGASCAAPDAAGPRAGAHRRGAGRGGRAHRGPRPRDPAHQPRPALARRAGGGGGRLHTSPTSSRTRPPRPRPTPPPAACSTGP